MNPPSLWFHSMVGCFALTYSMAIFYGYTAITHRDLASTTANLQCQQSTACHPVTLSFLTCSVDLWFLCRFNR